MPDEHMDRTLERLSDAGDDYEFANLDSEDMDRITDAEKRLNANRNREVILLAYEKRPR